MSIPIDVELDGAPLPYRALWLQDGQKDIWVVTDAGGKANDDQYGGNWFQVCERGSIGTMYALWDILG